MSDPAITIDLIAPADRETGAPETDVNRDTAFDEDEATDARHEYLIIDRSTEQIIVPVGAHATASTAINVPVETPFEADEDAARADWQKPRPPALPAPWAMSIRELDSWHAYYDDRERLGLAPLTNADRRHRAEVEQNIHMRREARRHSCYP